MELFTAKAAPFESHSHHRFRCHTKHNASAAFQQLWSQPTVQNTPMLQRNSKYAMFCVKSPLKLLLPTRHVWLTLCVRTKNRFPYRKLVAVWVTWPQAAHKITSMRPATTPCACLGCQHIYMGMIGIWGPKATGVFERVAYWPFFLEVRPPCRNKTILQ